MKKIFKLWGVASLAFILALGFLFSPVISRADTESTNTGTSTESGINNNGDHEDVNKTENSSGDNADEEDAANDEERHQEGDVNKDLKDLGDIESEIKVEKVSYQDLNTYGDVIAVLNSFKTEIAKIKANAAVADQATSSLSVAERNLLDKLLNKHKAAFNALNSRISEVEAQINELIELLTPIADQKIDRSLKNLLYTELRDFRSEIKDSANLESLNIEALNQETL